MDVISLRQPVVILNEDTTSAIPSLVAPCSLHMGSISLNSLVAIVPIKMDFANVVDMTTSNYTPTHTPASQQEALRKFVADMRRIYTRMLKGRLPKDEGKFVAICSEFFDELLQVVPDEITPNQCYVQDYGFCSFSFITEGIIVTLTVSRPIFQSQLRAS